ncbi:MULTISPECIES: hypothetical protein [unclassified Mesorhizobium]|uniref:hypothetical protein n=1 Tax=unclassified Mesorhizobium TaxID=325217 RepID=UPI000F7565AD|nr:MULTISPECIES: hypothetical protein [unclassified Mesorhizobium]AZO71296.1 hypothetical protein EJ067_08975 [Mesorhizobium sp. M1D.F.Ca.ET.043.01.1.1]RWA94529.1 MAG: hypothetical protein EOQ32_11885 [Mesorhizobium sp.]
MAIFTARTIHDRDAPKVPVSLMSNGHLQTAPGRQDCEWPSAANEQWLVFITLLAAERCGNAGDESANDHRQGADQRESGTRLPGRSEAAFA